MAKTEDLKNDFGNRMKKGTPVRKSLDDRLKEGADGERTESAKAPTAAIRRGRAAAERIGHAYNYTSLHIEPGVYEQLREIARRNRLTYTEVVNAAFRKYVELYEARHGSLETPRESNISADSLV